MACGMRETVTVRYWGVCWKWGFIPYPCRKTKTEVKYRYDFLPWRTRFSWSPFRRSYEGCCNGTLFEWSYWTWSPFGTGNGPWINQTLTYFSGSTIGSIGSCPFNENTATPPVSIVASGSIVPAEVTENLKRRAVLAAKGVFERRKWTPVHVKRTHQTKIIEPRF